MVVIAEWLTSPCGLKLREVPSNGNYLKGFKKEILPVEDEDANNFKFNKHAPNMFGINAFILIHLYYT